MRNNSNNSRQNSSQSAKDMGVTTALLKEIERDEVSTYFFASNIVVI